MTKQERVAVAVLVEGSGKGWATRKAGQVVPAHSKQQRELLGAEQQPASRSPAARGRELRKITAELAQLTARRAPCARHSLGGVARRRSACTARRAKRPRSPSVPSVRAVAALVQVDEQSVRVAGAPRARLRRRTDGRRHLRRPNARRRKARGVLPRRRALDRHARCAASVERRGSGSGKISGAVARGAATSAATSASVTPITSAAAPSKWCDLRAPGACLTRRNPRKESELVGSRSWRRCIEV